MSLAQAIREVRDGHCQRIAVPGLWRVWRDGGRVLWEWIK